MKATARLFQSDRAVRRTRLIAERLPDNWLAMRWPRLATSCALFFLIIASAASAKADIFTINPALSSLTLSGSTNGSPFLQQGPGSLVTSYFGTIDASFNASSITFNSATATANNSGNWQPGPGGVPGSAPANYGVMATVFPFTALGAGRNLQFSLTSPNPITLTGTAFDASQINLTVLSGLFDYLVAGVTNGTLNEAGLTGPNAATGGMFTITGGIATLTIPILFTQTVTVINPNDTTFTFAGTLVATAAVPEGSTSSLLLVGTILLLCGWPLLRRRLQLI